MAILFDVRQKDRRQNMMIEEGGALKGRKGQKERKGLSSSPTMEDLTFGLYLHLQGQGEVTEDEKKGSDRSYSLVSRSDSATAGLIVAGGVRFICENHILVGIAPESGDSVVLLPFITAFHGLSLPDKSIEYRKFSATSSKSLSFLSVLRFSAQNAVLLSIPFINFL
jgi:hypothetical protein